MPLPHQCAVCWAMFDDHKGWVQHAEQAHDAKLREFGLDSCRGSYKITNGDRLCPGINHQKQLARAPVTRRPAPAPQPFVARDGTTYTPQEMF